MTAYSELFQLHTVLNWCFSVWQYLTREDGWNLQCLTPSLAARIVTVIVADILLVLAIGTPLILRTKQSILVKDKIAIWGVMNTGKKFSCL